jgi:competence protein ComEC
VPLLAPIQNVWVGPILSAEVFTASLAAFSKHLSVILSVGFAFLTKCLSDLLLFFPSLLGNSLSLRPAGPGSFTPAVTAGFYLALILFSLLVKSRVLRDIFYNQRLKLGLVTVFLAASFIFSAILLVYWTPQRNVRPGFLTIDFLDVGQGDCALVTFPDGKTLLIDSGGIIDFNPQTDDAIPLRYGIGEKVVSGFLWQKGITRLDYVLVSHSDLDHLGGLFEIIDSNKPEKIFIAKGIKLSPVMARFLESATLSGISVEEVSAGYKAEIGGAGLQIIWPGPLPDLKDNNNSIVLKISYNQFTALFTGDIEARAEEMIIRSGSDISAKILKVAHHGSRSSSTIGFIEAVNPELAIISAGRYSVYGHPHPEVVSRFLQKGVNLLSTQSSGWISITSDGSMISVNCFLPCSPDIISKPH